jgi:hypothetical protein
MAGITTRGRITKLKPGRALIATGKDGEPVVIGYLQRVKGRLQIYQPPEIPVKISLTTGTSAI